jgi:hypothetical protein
MNSLEREFAQVSRPYGRKAEATTPKTILGQQAGKHRHGVVEYDRR